MIPEKEFSSCFWPSRLTPGSTIGFWSPSSPADPESVGKGAEILRAMGFQVVIPELETHPEFPYLAGSDAKRVDSFHRMVADLDIQAILCTRGGYGALRMVSCIDFESVRRHPKPFMGFSDATVLLSEISRRTGMVTMHGPVATSLMISDEATRFATFRMLTQRPPFQIHAPQGIEVVAGTAQGRIAGGNLATCCHLAGTPFAPDWSGCIVVLEDVGEPAYKIDRMLTQMRMAGMFDSVRGIVAGTFTCGAPGEAVVRILEDRLGDLGIPLIAGFPIGHGPENHPFPVGAMGRIDSRSLCISWEPDCGK